MRMLQLAAKPTYAKPLFYSHASSNPSLCMTRSTACSQFVQNISSLCMCFLYGERKHGKKTVPLNLVATSATFKMAGKVCFGKTGLFGVGSSRVCKQVHWHISLKSGRQTGRERDGGEGGQLLLFAMQMQWYAYGYTLWAKELHPLIPPSPCTAYNQLTM